MPLISPRLAAQIQRRTADAAYTDLAYYIIPPDPEVTDEYGQPVGTETLVPVSCSFTDKPNAERWRGDVDIEQLAAEIRFTAPAPSKSGRVRIVERFGEPVVNREFEIIGIQDRGAFGYVAALKAVSL